jgi:hypothetical protein
MRVASVGVYVREGSPLAARAVVRESGEPWGWLDVGEAVEVSVYGSPAALRRLASELVEAAAIAERAREDGVPVVGAAA